MKSQGSRVYSTHQNILIVNDQAAVRNGLRVTINRLQNIGSCDLAIHGRDAIDLMKRKHYHLVLLDINMPVMDGPTAYANMRKYFPGSKIMIVSMSKERKQIIEFIRGGIDGYLIADTDEEELMDAVQTVLDGRRYLTPRVELIWTDFQHLDEEQQAAFIQLQLSHREIEVIRCICHQMSAKQIADQLNISEFTVNNHRSRIIKKMGVDNTVGMVIEALRRGIVEL